ncbi:MAG: MarR family winged helix-turn-helix transcriptional regulator [Bacteroidales bacterium]
MEKTPDTNVLQPVGRILSRLGKSYLHLMNAKLNYIDIKREYYALILIELGNNNITQNELARQLETDKVSIVRIIDYLAATGYVDRVRSSTDRRKYCLTLTDKAKKALPEIKKVLNEVRATAFESLSESQVALFYLTLNTIKTNLIKANTSGI